MSLVPTYVQSASGIWYKNPEIRFPAWFVCWDDDDPIELVFRPDVITQIEIMSFLSIQPWSVKVLSPGLAGQRLFEGQTPRPGGHNVS